nr:hypothetical protein [uncultured Flavobacterium sp.]
MKYIAREGGSALKTAANKVLKDQLVAIKGLGENGLNVAINMKHDLPNEWHLFKKNGTIGLTIDKSRLPYMVQTFDTTEIKSIMLVAKVKDNSPAFIIKVDDTTPLNLSRKDDIKLCIGVNSSITLDTLFSLSISDADKEKLEDLLIVVKYTF